MTTVVYKHKSLRVPADVQSTGSLAMRMATRPAAEFEAFEERALLRLIGRWRSLQLAAFPPFSRVSVVGAATGKVIRATLEYCVALDAAY